MIQANSSLIPSWQIDETSEFIAQEWITKIQNISSTPLIQSDWHKVALIFYELNKEDITQLSALKEVYDYAGFDDYSRVDFAYSWLEYYLSKPQNLTLVELAKQFLNNKKYYAVNIIENLFPISSHMVDKDFSLIDIAVFDSDTSELFKCLRGDRFKSEKGLVRVFGGYLGLGFDEMQHCMKVKEFKRILQEQDRVKEESYRLNWQQVACAFDKMRMHCAVQRISNFYSRATESYHRRFLDSKLARVKELKEKKSTLLHERIASWLVDGNKKNYSVSDFTQAEFQIDSDNTDYSEASSLKCNELGAEDLSDSGSNGEWKDCDDELDGNTSDISSCESSVFENFDIAVKKRKALL